MSNTIRYPFGKLDAVVVEVDEEDVAALEVVNDKTFFQLELEDDTELDLTAGEFLNTGAEVNALITFDGEHTLSFGDEVLALETEREDEIALFTFVYLGGKFILKSVSVVGDVEE